MCYDCADTKVSVKKAVGTHPEADVVGTRPGSCDLDLRLRRPPWRSDSNQALKIMATPQGQCKGLVARRPCMFTNILLFSSFYTAIASRRLGA